MAEKPHLDREQTQRAVGCLLKQLPRNGVVGHDELLEDAVAVQLIVGLRSAPPESKGRIKPVLLPVPHSVWPHPEACLFVKEPHKPFKELLRANPVEGVKRVVGLDKLRKWRSYQIRRRELLNSFDFFLCDDRIVLFMTKLLGKKFLERRRQPIPVRAETVSQLRKDMARVLSSVSYFPGWGNCINLRVGHNEMSEGDLVENIFAAAEALAHKLEKGWSEVQSISIKLQDSDSIPIFNSLP